jgi:RNA polymerase sigma factor (sigma-70 family)
LKYLIPMIDTVCVRSDETEISDVALVSLAKSGDRDAFVELAKRHSNRSFQAAYRITKNREDAEDAVQESLLSAFRHIKCFQERSSFSTWLTRITMNSALMMLRKRQVDKVVSLDGSDAGVEYCAGIEPPSRMENPEDQLVRKERRELLKGAILRLPPRSRSVVELRRTRGLSLQQIAESAGITLPAVKSRLARATRALRTSLQDS